MLLRWRQQDVLVRLLSVDEEAELEDGLVGCLGRLDGDGAKFRVAFWDVPDAC